MTAFIIDKKASVQFVAFIFVQMLLFTPCGYSQVVQTPSPEMDAQFVALQKAFVNKQTAAIEQTAKKLYNHDLNGFIEYYRLSSRIANSSDPLQFSDDVELYLQRYQGQATANRLRNDWLLVLGARGAWQQFDEHYAAFELRDDPSVECYAQLSKIITSNKIPEQIPEPFTQTPPKSWGNGCLQLFKYLFQNGFPSESLVGIVRLAAEAKQLATTQSYLRILGKTTDEPMIRLTQLAKTNPDKAMSIWSATHMQLSPAAQSAVLATIATEAAKNFAPQASEWFAQQMSLNNDQWLSLDNFEWRVRSFLLNEQWDKVEQAIHRMPPFLRENDNTWVFWLGYSHFMRKNIEQTDQYWRNLYPQWDFYAQLANAHRENSRPIPADEPTPDDIEFVENHPGLRRSQRLYNLGLTFESNREWNWTMRRFTDAQLLAAAKYGIKINRIDRAIYSASRTKVQHNLTLRYPTPFWELAQNASQASNTPLAWIYGISRQESRFQRNAQSTVGASGLMQVMPATAAMVARKIGLPYSKSLLNSPEYNLKLGSEYLNQMYEENNQSYLEASAAYNAGPGRMKQWRSRLRQPVIGEVFIENIPFYETRDYVKQVLTNTHAYHQTLTNKPSLITEWIKEVQP